MFNKQSDCDKYKVEYKFLSELDKETCTYGELATLLAVKGRVSKASLDELVLHSNIVSGLLVAKEQCNDEHTQFYVGQIEHFYSLITACNSQHEEL